MHDLTLGANMVDTESDTGRVAGGPITRTLTLPLERRTTNGSARKKQRVGKLGSITASTGKENGTSGLRPGGGNGGSPSSTLSFVDGRLCSFMLDSPNTLTMSDGRRSRDGTGSNGKRSRRDAGEEQNAFSSPRKVRKLDANTASADVLFMSPTTTRRMIREPTPMKSPRLLPIGGNFLRSPSLLKAMSMSGVSTHSRLRRRMRRRVPRISARNLGDKDFPVDVLSQIFTYLNLKEICVCQSVSKQFQYVIDQPSSWEMLVFDVDQQKRPSVAWWKRMVEKGAFDTVQTLRIFRAQAETFEEEEAKNPGIFHRNLLVTEKIFVHLAPAMRNVKVMTLEFRDVQYNYEDFFKAVATILRGSSKHLEMILFHTDCYTKPFPLPDVKFPSLIHLNFAGDLNPDRNFLQLSTSIKWLKLTCNPRDTEIALEIVSKNQKDLREITFRPSRGAQDAFETVDLSKLVGDQYGLVKPVLTTVNTLEWNTLYCGGVSNDQLIQLVRIPKHFIKISTKALNDRVCDELLANDQNEGIFIGSNSILDRHRFVRNLLKKPCLKWLRLTSEGPVLTDEETHQIEMKHPGIRLWTRVSKPEDHQEVVNLWDLCDDEE